MLGLSFGKILLIVLVIVAIWKGLKILRQFQAQLEARNRAAVEAQERRKGPEASATTLVPCPHCGTYIANGTYCQCRDKR
jgi:hypothetical protein